jgi:hypothetical protein
LIWVLFISVTKTKVVVFNVSLEGLINLARGWVHVRDISSSSLSLRTKDVVLTSELETRAKALAVALDLALSLIKLFRSIELLIGCSKESSAHLLVTHLDTARKQLLLEVSSIRVLASRMLEASVSLVNGLILVRMLS